jgi:hypothetical protein
VQRSGRKGAVHIDVVVLILLASLAAWTELDKRKKRRKPDCETEKERGLSTHLPRSRFRMRDAEGVSEFSQKHRRSNEFALYEESHRNWLVR